MSVKGSASLEQDADRLNLIFRDRGACATRSHEIRYAALRSTFDLFDSDGPWVVASALGALTAARRGARSDERSSHHVVERNTYATTDCAVFI